MSAPAATSSSANSQPAPAAAVLADTIPMLEPGGTRPAQTTNAAPAVQPAQVRRVVRPGDTALDPLLVRDSVSDVVLDHNFARTAARWILSEEFYCHIAVRAMFFADNQSGDLVDQLFKWLPNLPDEYERSLKLTGGDLRDKAARMFDTRPSDIEPLRQAIFAYELLATLFGIQYGVSPGAVHIHHEKLLFFLRNRTYWWCKMLSSVSRQNVHAQKFNDVKLADTQSVLGIVLAGAENPLKDYFDYSVTFMPWIVRAIRIATQEQAAKLVYEHHFGDLNVHDLALNLHNEWTSDMPSASKRAPAAIPAMRSLLLSFMPKVYYDFVHTRMFKAEPNLDYWVQADRAAATWMMNPSVPMGAKGRRRPFRYTVDREEGNGGDLEWEEHTTETLWKDMANEPIVAYSVLQLFGHLRVFKDSFFDNVVRVSQEPLGMWLVACAVYAHLQFELAQFQEVEEIKNEIEKFIKGAPRQVRSKDNEMVKLLLIQIIINTRLLDEAGASAVLDSDRERAAVEMAKTQARTTEAVEDILKVSVGQRTRLDAPAAIQRLAVKRRAMVGEGKQEKGLPAEAQEEDEESKELKEDLAQSQDRLKELFPKQKEFLDKQRTAINLPKVKRETKQTFDFVSYDLTATDDELSQEIGGPLEETEAEALKRRARERQEAAEQDRLRAENEEDIRRREEADELRLRGSQPAATGSRRGSATAAKPRPSRRVVPTVFDGSESADDSLSGANAFASANAPASATAPAVAVAPARAPAIATTGAASSSANAVVLSTPPRQPQARLPTDDDDDDSPPVVARRDFGIMTTPRTLIKRIVDEVGISPAAQAASTSAMPPLIAISAPQPAAPAPALAPAPAKVASAAPVAASVPAKAAAGRQRTVIPAAGKKDKNA